MADSSPHITRERVTALDVVRLLVELFAVFSLGFWGFSRFGFPAGIVAGVLAPLAAIAVWALFVSPKAVVRVHPFLRAVIELAVFAAATVTWWDLGQVWVGLGFAAVAIASGVLVGRNRLS